MQITNIPPSYPPKPFEPKLPSLIMQLMMGYVKRDEERKRKAKERKEVEEIDLKKWARQTAHDYALAEKRSDLAMERTMQSEQLGAERLGWKEIPADDVPFDSDEPPYKIGEKFYIRPEQPVPRVAPIPGTNQKLLTFRSGGKTHARVLNPLEAPDWEKKNKYYQGLRAKGAISEEEYKKGLGVYIKGKTVSMFMQHPGGIQSVQVEPKQVEKMEQLGFTKGTFTPAKEKKPDVNQLIKMGEQLIGTGLNMNVSILEKYDANRQKDYFDTLKLYHKILEKKPSFKTAEGVRKAVDFSIRIDQLAVNDKGVVMGKLKESQTWIILE